MRQFTQLYTELDETNRTNVKRWLRWSGTLPPCPRKMRAYAYFSGPGVASSAPSPTRRCARGWRSGADLPLWLVESLKAVGDLAETLLLLPGNTEPDGPRRTAAAPR
ncbi:MAG: hypothetical protein R2838_22000 [Caldilineaceae bacterium]